MEKEGKRVVRVVYHCPCPDGAFAALAAYLRFHKDPQVDVSFVPHSTSHPLRVEDNPTFTPDAHVFLLDYVGRPDLIRRLASKVRHVTLLDHHDTAFELLEKWKSEDSLPHNFDYQLIKEKSGAVIAYEYFSQDQTLIANETDRTRIERVYAYIEDGDLRQRALPQSAEFARHALLALIGLGAKSIEFNITRNKSLFLQLQLLDADALIEKGSDELVRVNCVIADNLARSFPIKLGGTDHDFGSCLAVLTKSPQLRSEMGHQLACLSAAAGLRGIGAICYEEKGKSVVDGDKNYKVSLRAVLDEDTTAIAKCYGGGGHKDASSFILPREEWVTWKTTAVNGHLLS